MWAHFVWRLVILTRVHVYVRGAGREAEGGGGAAVVRTHQYDPSHTPP